MISLLYELICIWVICAGAVSAFMPLLGFGSAGIWHVLFGVLVSATPAVFRKSGWMGKLVISGICVTLLLAGFFLSKVEAVHLFFMIHTEWISIFIISLISFVIGEIVVHLPVARFILLAASAGAVIISSAYGFSPEKLTVTAVLTYALMTCIEEIQKRWQKSGYTEGRKHLVYVMLFVLLTMMPVFLLPAPDEPYDWALFKKIYRSVSESLQHLGRRLSSDGVYDPTNSMIGFSGRGDIRGNISHSDDEVMVLMDLSSAIPGVRLGGRSFDSFSGNEWSDTDTSEACDELLDTIAFYAAASGSAENPDDYYRRSSFKISYTGFSSPYLFAPVKSIIGNNGYESGTTYYGGDIRWNDPGKIPESYWVSYYRMNSANPAFGDLIESTSVPGEQEYNASLAELSLDDTSGLSYSDYLAHRDRIYEVYTDAPVISEELADYLEDLYEGTSSQQEKMDRLCKALRKFVYTDSPGDLPEYVTDPGSMLDYFMLESGRGFCTYFATAFVLLARAEGLPARYVQGYLVETTGQRNVTVYTYMAHAWPEIYYDGIGWVAYEPTPGMGSFSYWRTAEENREFAQGISAGYPGMQEDEAEEAAGDMQDTPGEDPGPVIPVRAIVIPLFSGLCFIAFFFVIGNAISELSFRKKKINERYAILCRQDMYLLKLLGFCAMQGETLAEFSDRVSEDTPEETAAFIEDMSDYLYAGNEELAPSEKRASEYRDILLKRLRKESFLKFLGFYLGLRKTK